MDAFAFVHVPNFDQNRNFSIPASTQAEYSTSTQINWAGSVPEKYFLIKNIAKISKRKDIKKVIVPNKTCHEVKIQVNQCDMILEWEYELKNHDIGFKIMFEEGNPNGIERMEVIPMYKFETECEPIKGMLRCTKKGIYIIGFDNSYSWFNSKEVYYKIWLTTQKERTKDLDRFNSCQAIYSQFGLAIHQNDHQARRRFVKWAQNEIAVVPDFHKRILFSDEAHFWLNGYVNKQNCRIWSEANPQVYVKTPLHPETLTVWCALWAGGIIGPYFFKNDEGHNITVNGDRYRAMIINFFIPELNNHDVQELWFQQDGATCHTARATIDLLKDTFGDHLISRFGPVN
ncbi:uncharacterized protein TNCV_2191461 [Trichonephila clavipes]|nr:uncharacterized protein TNCV_2191461 [Trichonephila clavipes]